MAKIQGVTIELSADASGIETALKGVTSESIKTQKELGQIDRALKFDPGNTVLLQQKMEVLGDAVNNTSTKLDALRQAQQDLDRQAAEGRAIDPKQYRALAREIEMTEGQLRSFQAQVDRTQVRIDAQTDVTGLDRMTQKLEEVGEKAKDVGDKMKNVGTEMSTKLTAPLAAFGGGALLAAGQFDNAMGQIQAALGITADEAAALEDQATSVWKAGFGESLEEVANSLIRVKQNMKEIDGNEIEGITKNALALAKTFDSDVNEVTRAANNLMVNFGITSGEAFDLLAYGAQNGLNFSNELFDNVAEYSGLFSTLGFESEEYFNALIKGSQEGIYNLDYLNDVVKEFGIRIKDGSKSTTEAIAYLFADDGINNFIDSLKTAGSSSEAYKELMAKVGKETADLWTSDLKKTGKASEDAATFIQMTMGSYDEFMQGMTDGSIKGSDAMQMIIEKIQALDDPTTRAQMGVSLFGTKWEDLEETAMFSLTNIGGEIENLEGSMQSVTEAQEQTFGQRWNNFTRTAAASLEPLGKILLDFAEQWLPRVIAVVESLATWFSNLSPVMQGVTVAFGAIVAAIGPMIAIFGAIASGISTLLPLFASGGALATGFGAALTAMTGPIGLTVAAIAGIGFAVQGIAKDLDQSSIELETWEGQVSEGTAKAVGSFMKLYDEASLAMANLSIGNQVVTQEMASNMIAIYDQMGQQVLAEMQGNHTEQLAAVTDFYANSNVLIESEEAEILAKTAEYQANQEKQVSEGNERIKEILTTASNQKRELTLAEQAEINRIQGVMKDNAIEYMTENQREQQVILETMKNNASKITAQQAAEVVKNSSKQKDEVISEAEEQYKKAVAEIIKQRDEMGVISGSQAKQLIEDAGKQRDETIKAAEKMHTDVVSEAKKQATEHVNQVDWTKGEVKSKWEVMKSDVSTKMKEIGTNIKNDWTTAHNDTVTKLNEMVSSGKEKFDEMKSDVSTKMKEIGSNIKKDWTTAYNDTVTKLTEMVSSGREKFDEMKSAVETKMGEVKTKIETKWGEARRFLEGIDLLQIGRDIVDGLIRGIGDKFGGVRTKIEELAGMIPDWAKKVLGIKSPSRVMRDEVGMMIGEGLAIGIERSGNDVIKASEKVVDGVKKTFEELPSTINGFAKESFRDIQSIRDTYSELYSTGDDYGVSLLKFLRTASQMGHFTDYELSEINEKIRFETDLAQYRLIDMQKNYSENVVRIENERVNKQLEAVKHYEDEVTKRTAEIAKQFGLLENVEIKDIGTDELTNSLESQISSMELYVQSMEKLSTRGLNNELLEEIGKLGPKMAGEVAAFADMSESELNRYIELWNKKNVIARQTAESELTAMRLSMEAELKQIDADAERELDKYKQNYEYLYNEVHGITDREMNELKHSMVRDGADAMQGLINGMQSMRSSVISTAQSIADAVSSTIQGALDIHSPSRVMKGFGVNIGQGLVSGMDDMIQKVAESSKRLSNAVTSAQVSLNNSALNSRALASNIHNTSSTVDNSRSFAPTVNVYTTESPEKVMQRELRRMAFQF